VTGYPLLPHGLQEGGKIWERAAEAGHVDARLLLARLYIEGTACRGDPLRAGELFAQAKAAMQPRR
jgi:TPR repeat protein